MNMICNPEMGVDSSATTMTPTRALVSVVTSIRPPVLSKKFSLEASGDLTKHSGGIMVEGTVEVREVEGLAALSDLLTGLNASQALIYGVPNDPEARQVTSRQIIESAPAVAGRIARTNETFGWPEGSGIMMLDYDPEPGVESLSRDALVAALRAAIPGLSSHAMLWWMSASSGIYNGQDVLRGEMGQRIWLQVTDASDIPRAGKVLSQRLWLQNMGTIRVSSSGQMLERTLVDTAVWQPSRLDFAGGAHCIPPLHQDRGHPIYIHGEVSVADTRSLFLDLTSSELTVLSALRESARDRQKDHAAKRRAEWVARRQADMVKLMPVGLHSSDKTEQVMEVLDAAIRDNILRGEYVVHVQGDEGVVPVSVRQILADPGLYDGRLCQDPLEPNYREGAWVGKIFSLSRSPTIHTFAHGGAVYSLSCDRIRVEYSIGKLSHLAENIVEHLAKSQTFFDYGDHLALVKQGALHVVTEHALGQQLGLEFSCFKVSGEPPPKAEAKVSGPTIPKPKTNSPQAVECEIPQIVSRRIIEMRNRRNLRQISGVITAPTIRQDGSILKRHGYDQVTQLYFDRQPDTVEIPDAPTLADAASALETLMRPFREFPFVSGLDRAAHLGAILTAITRPVLATAPAFAYDAPTAGSGKTLLAACVAAIAEGRKPDFWPHVSREEEIRKRILSALLSSARVLLWDNVTEEFDSASMAALLTGTAFIDRVLGQSQAQRIPNRMLVLMTGNNFTLTGDLMRRVITCRIDPAGPEPYARVFDVDPLQLCLDDRQAMIAAGCTLMRARHILHPSRVAPGRLAAFEGWDDLVRQCVVWVDQVISPGQFGDPMELIRESYGQDQERQALSILLCELDQEFGGSSFSARDIISRLHSPNLESAVSDLGGENALRSPRSLGRILRKCLDRPVDALRLVARKGSANTLAYMIRKVEIAE